MNIKYVLGIIIALLVGATAYTFVLNDDHHDDHGHEHHDDHKEIVANEPVRADGEFTLATSFYPLQYAVEQIVGELGVVTNIGANTDPHDFKPTTQDILSLQRADLVVLQGADFEPWGDDVMDRLKADGVPVVIATDAVELHEGGHDHDDHAEEDGMHEEEGEHESEHGLEHDEDHEEKEDHEHEDEHDDEHKHDHGAYDPHTWLDPVLFSETVLHIAEAIAVVDPENASEYAANAAVLVATLETLDTEYQTTLGTCALDEVITSHDAFGYLAERYGFEVHSIAGLSTQDTPSVATLAALKEEAEEGIGAILLEANSIAAYGETLARETGLQTLSLSPIAYAISETEDYMSLMQSNLATFAEALQCNE